MNQEKNDDQLWQIAKARVAFKSSLLSYLIVNFSLNVIWFFTTREYGYYWPIWPALGWGIGLVFQYFNAYQNNKLFSTETEYNRLKNKNN